MGIFKKLFNVPKKPVFDGWSIPETSLWGLDPKDDNSILHFINGYWWPALWEYVVMNCSDILATDEIELGRTNGKLILLEFKTKKMGRKLEKILASGEVAKYEIEFKDRKDMMNKETDESYSYEFYKRAGSFSEKAIKGYAEFCKNCGGYIQSESPPPDTDLSRIPEPIRF